MVLGLTECKCQYQLLIKKTLNNFFVGLITMFIFCILNNKHLYLLAHLPMPKLVTMI